jgi:flagellin-like hook-associated protein FlgL
LKLIAQEIDRIVDTTAYKGEFLIDGTYTDQILPFADSGISPTGVRLQVGARTKDLKHYDFDYAGVWWDRNLQRKSIGKLEANITATAEGLGLLTADTNLASQENANTALDRIDHAINKVSMIRATFGSIQNRLEHKIENLGQTAENLTGAESRIRDTDMAEEMMKFTKEQILAQSAQAMLAQANQIPQGVLQLIQ